MGSFIIILSIIWACERAIAALANRSKPVQQCCCACTSNEDEEEE